MHRFAFAGLILLALGGFAPAQRPCQTVPLGPPVVLLGAPIPDVTPFQGARYSFHQPAIFSSSYYAPSYIAPRLYNPRDPKPGPYYYTPAYSFTPGYYSYYYTPGYFRY
jgi:hypothetical protein